LYEFERTQAEPLEGNNGDGKRVYHCGDGIYAVVIQIKREAIMDVKAVVLQKFQDRKGEFELLKKGGIDFVNKLMTDCKEVLTDLPTMKDFVNVIVDLVDDSTNTGLIDPFDAPLAMYIFSRFDSDKLESWYKARRDEILGAKVIDNGQTPA
jgi:hypothetical protein